MQKKGKTSPTNEDRDKDKNKDGYASVGGLDKQIAQIRDLIEIPLTRPDLFRHFGAPAAPSLH